MTDFGTFLRAVEAAPDRILGDDYHIFPPNPDYGHDATRRNALTVRVMGVDGVH